MLNKEWQIVIEFFGFKSKYSQPEVDGSRIYQPVTEATEPISNRKYLNLSVKYTTISNDAFKFLSRFS